MTGFTAGVVSTVLVDDWFHTSLDLDRLGRSLELDRLGGYCFHWYLGCDRPGRWVVSLKTWFPLPWSMTGFTEDLVSTGLVDEWFHCRLGFYRLVR